MVEAHRDEIVANLAQHKRSWADVVQYLPDNMIDWAHWLLDHPAALRRKTIRLTKELREETTATPEVIFARVARVIEQFSTPNWAQEYGDEVATPHVELLVAPTGSRKSTQVRAAAVHYLQEHPGKSVVILVPRHKLGNEQIEALRREHPNGNFQAAVWRGRHASDPDTSLKMCQRSEEAKELEVALLDVDHHLCKQGRGKKAVKCPLFNGCSYQAQKKIKANIWFAAHEVMVHAMPEAFGNVALLIIDESPLDAFMFGVDDVMALALDKLRDPPTSLYDKEDAKSLKQGRRTLYDRLDKHRVPINPYLGIPVAIRKLDLDGFGGLAGWNKSARNMRVLEWKGKTVPAIRPDMSAQQVREKLAEAAGNDVIKARTTLWGLIEQALNDHYNKQDGQYGVCGRIQLHRSNDGRIIRMVGLHTLAKGWNVRTLICDATGDVELLKAIWPQIKETEAHG